MRVVFIGVLLVLQISACSLGAANLMEITLHSQSEAQLLARLQVDAVVKTNAGYLVLAESTRMAAVLNSGLEAAMIAEGVERNELALDLRLDNFNVSRYQTVYVDGNLRVYRVPGGYNPAQEMQPSLMPIPARSLRIVYQDEGAPRFKGLAQSSILDQLVGTIDQDSLYSYVSRLQSYYRRVAGTPSIFQARDWIESKFESFGYDSVYLDHWSQYFNGTTNQCYNVVAVKTGTKYPEIEIIVGAHYDGVTVSPAADDNGSGTAGVLEVARALAGTPTEVTFKFITFDAEEWGLYGSYHYAGEAADRGDQIILMFNMDMIASISNWNRATIYHGSNTVYANMWKNIAQASYGISGVLGGNSGGSDHYPFTQEGYPAVFIIEYYFSSVYHSPMDSTSYMNFEYMTRMVRASLATVFQLANSGDFDNDGVQNDFDNCLFTANPAQEDPDADSVGSLCDNCPDVFNPMQLDDDGNGIGDVCDESVHITSYVLPLAQRTIPYSYQMEAVGGLQPYSWTWVGGDLPFGLTFDSPDGTIAGIPTYNATYYFTVAVFDASVPLKTDTISVSITVTDPELYICGDANNSEVVNISDAVYLVNYIFASGPAPEPLESGDADCSDLVNISDAVYLVNYIFGGGPMPCAGCLP